MALDGRAEKLIEEGEAILKKGGGFFGALLGVSSDKYEEAAEKFSRAGLAFKGAGRWADAAKAYRRSGDAYVKAKSLGEASTAYTEAARAYIKVGDVTTATDLLNTEVLPRIIDSGRLSQAAKLHQELAEMLETEEQYAEAIHNFEQAANFFTAENSTGAAQKASVRIAHICAIMPEPDLRRSAELFERVAGECLSNNLLKFQAKNYLFNAVLCTLARGDVVDAEHNLNKYKDMDYTFPGSRECKLAEDIVQAVKDMNADAFTDAVYNFDQISKLDNWRTPLLLKVKNSISGSAGAGAPGAAAGGGDLGIM